ncbi:aldo/keto reductase [Terribacillus sp. 7520-G]|uniref:aldo/keto reductase n=1 Tax=Terribacillus TaxID=459532 RepID=UPI000BA715B5|nr:aldo/keto reductase [Terribacillus sp. 7520-G]PAD37893.1 aldo/keto reductase [Terribacillus sp. 7520-G]
MKYTAIPGIERPLSKLILGTTKFFEDKKQDVFSVLDAFLQAGGNTIDTGPKYAKYQAEKLIGQWMQERGTRKDVILISKGGHYHIDRDGTHHPELKRVDPVEITKDLHESLGNLQTDFIDIYLIHRDDRSVSVQELMDMLHEHQQAGKIGIYGVSNWQPDRIEEANAYADSKGYDRLMVNSPNLSLAQLNEVRWAGTVALDDEYLAWHRRTGMPVISWAAQAGGFFTGTYDRNHVTDEEIARVYYNDDNWERYDRAVEIANRKGVTANQIAVAYVLHQAFPTCAIVGCKNVRRLEEALPAIDIQLTEEEVKWLNLELEDAKVE